MIIPVPMDTQRASKKDRWNEMSVKQDLIYYLGYAPPGDIVREAEAWVRENPEVNLAEWVDAMIEIGEL